MFSPKNYNPSSFVHNISLKIKNKKNQKFCP